MKTWSFFDEASGLFTGAMFSGPESALALNTPPGCRAIDGVFDCRRQRVTPSGAVEPWRPPQPQPDEWRTWAWDAADWSWQPVPTEAALWRDVRAERDRRLAATDWRALRAMETGEAMPSGWTAYRQALRDVTLQPDPTAIVWPTPPEA